MDVLIVDSAARGHAEAYKIAQSPDCDRLWLAPGNGGSEDIAESTGLEPLDVDGIVKFAKQNADLTIVSADAPLKAGLIDALEQEKLLAFGPTKEAAKIEWSKIFSKRLAKELGIPTATYGVFGDYSRALNFAGHHGYPLYVKADGLSDGKGAIATGNLEEVQDALQQLASAGKFGNGVEALIEEGLEGPEISLHAFCDGESYRMVPFAMQDHKTIYNYDQGPMTGGLGVVRVPGITPEDIENLGRRFVAPVLKALKDSGHPFKGVLYPGLKLTQQGPKLLEWNARPGDPETQVWSMLLKDDLLPITMACIEGRLAGLPEIKWRQASAACIILAAKGYPDAQKTEKGAKIEGLQSTKVDKNNRVFHYASKLKGGDLTVNSGRVLAVVYAGDEDGRAQYADHDQYVINQAYQNTTNITFGGEKPQMRSDIGTKALSLAFKQLVNNTSHLF